MMKSKYIRIFIIIGFMSLAISIMLGAFASHSLKELLIESDLKIFDTASRYQMYMALGLLIISFNDQYFESKKLKIALLLNVVGILLFSGSLYILSCKFLLGIKSIGPLGLITPIGGLLLIISWVLLAFSLEK